VVLCLLLIFIALMLAFFAIPASMHYHVTERYTISGDATDASVYLSILIPKSGPYQWVGNINMFWDGEQQQMSFDPVDVVRLSGEKQVKEDVEAIIEYDVKLRQGGGSWEDTVETFQINPQMGIESDHYLIQERASELRRNLSFQSIPYRIYSFTSDHLTYSQVQEDCTSESALMSYEIGSCICAGYARLMVALSRASEIPAQMVVGFLYPDPFVKRDTSINHHNPGQAHAWVEYYSFGKWKIADPTLGSGIWKKLHFNRNDGRHVVYGELEQLSLINLEQKYWALKNANIPMGDHECFRFVATTNSDQISITPTVAIHKGWDGRWLNSIIVWAIASYLLCKYRNRIVAVKPPQIKNS